MMEEYQYMMKNDVWDIVLRPIEGGKNPWQQRGSLPIPQVPIRHTNVSNGRPGRVMDPLPYRGLFESVKLNQRQRVPARFSNLKS